MEGREREPLSVMGTPVCENRGDCPVQQPRALALSPVRLLWTLKTLPLLGNPFLGAAQGPGTWESLTLDSRVRSAPGEMKLGAPIQTCLSYTICHKLGSLENSSRSSNPSVMWSLPLELRSPTACGIAAGSTVVSPPLNSSPGPAGHHQDLLPQSPLTIILLVIPPLCLVYGQLQNGWNYLG